MQKAMKRGLNAGSIATAVVAALTIGLAGPTAATAAEPPPWMNTSLSPDERAALLLPEMTLEEKVDLMTDDPAPTGQELAYYNAGIERLGIPELRMADIGPGVRFGQEPTTAFPQGIAAAATWDLDGQVKVAQAVREEARQKRYNMILGPNVDIARNPWWSRIGESFGEDPLLSGRMAAAFVDSAQSERDMAVSLKHYNVYGQETNRNPADDKALTQNMIVDERTLQEFYTRAWSAPVATGLASVMCAFGKINGVQACENEHLNEDILRDRLGFDGFILTDYGATRPDTEATIEGGTNMETGAIAAYGPYLLAAVNEGRVSESLVDTRVLQILRTYFEFGIFDKPLQDELQPVAEEEHAALSRSVAEKAITLLKNDGGALPLSTPGSIAVVGQGATWLAQQCCAGATTNPTRSVTPLEAIQSAAPAGTTVSYSRGTDAPFAADLIQGPDAIPSSVLSVPGNPAERGVHAEYFDNTDLTGDPLEARTNLRAAYDNGLIAWFWNHPEVVQPPSGSVGARFTGVITAPATGDYRLSLSGYGTGRLVFEGQEILSFADQLQPDKYVSAPIPMTAGETYSFEMDYAATNARDGLDDGMVRLGWVPPAGVVSPDIQAAVETARHSDVAVVVAGLSETEARDRGELDLATEQDELIEAVSAVNPHTIVVLQGGGGVLMPWLDKVAGVVQTYYTGGEGANALAEILFGKVNPSGHLPISYAAYETEPTEKLGVANSLLNAPEPKVELTDGVNVGYRGYAAAGAKPLFPFGYGLSYTDFEYSGGSAYAVDGTVKVSFNLKNTGQRAGTEVAQVYSGKLPTDVATPVEQLAGWARVDLAAGETREVTVQVACKSLAYWDADAAKWVSPAGPVDLSIGSSSEDIKLTDTVTLPGGTCSEDSDLAMAASSATAEPPVVNVVVDPAAPTGSNGWYTGPVTVTPTATDNTDPSPLVEVNVDGSGWTTSGDSLQVSADGSHTVLVRATDAAGNVSVETTVSVNIDATAPQVTAQKAKNRLVISATDATSGVAKIEYRYYLKVGKHQYFDAWRTYNKPVLIGTGRILKVEYRAVDNAGNVSDRMVYRD